VTSYVDENEEIKYIENSENLETKPSFYIRCILEISAGLSRLDN